MAIANPLQKEKYSENPLEFWRDNCKNYPLLAKLASVSLGMSAGSVPVEKMFSVTGLILNSKRSQWSPSKLHKLIFLHDNVQKVLQTLDSDNCNLLSNSQTVGDRDGCLSAD